MTTISENFVLSRKPKSLEEVKGLFDGDERIKGKILSYTVKKSDEKDEKDEYAKMAESFADSYCVTVIVE